MLFMGPVLFIDLIYLILVTVKHIVYKKKIHRHVKYLYIHILFNIIHSTHSYFNIKNRLDLDHKIQKRRNNVLTI